MTPVGSAEFAILLWGTVSAVSAVFLYEVYVIAAEFGWIGGNGGHTGTSKPGDEL
ncbi:MULTISPECIES: hypothetical protein [unclassified Halorubrum]|jgi:hypothetical protein|uniref:hypothetical protein n=1 Tax=unclassified Halorubrum TaxID=2642239 RepID=UPI0013053D28|nr:MULTISPECIES: hypothetical protein [unclassified Halorubrum]